MYFFVTNISSDEVFRGQVKFTGWYTKKKAGTKVTAKTVIKKNISLYAHWARVGYVNKNCKWLHLRKAPMGKVKGVYKTGTKVLIIGSEGRWYKVQIGKATGYMHKKYVRPAKVR